MRIYVETEGKVTAGMTLPFRHPTRDPAKREAPNVRVCSTVDAERFLQLFLKCVRN
jgi:inosine-uridine nucleoside N-ribohydrolase